MYFRRFCDKYQILTPHVAGVESNVYVLCTALTALSNGFQTVILEDCVATSQEARQAPALQIIAVAKGRRMSRADFLKTLAPT
jgi:nicotinamidase-related amidase